MTLSSKQQIQRDKEMIMCRFRSGNITRHFFIKFDEAIDTVRIIAAMEMGLLDVDAFDQAERIQEDRHYAEENQQEFVQPPDPFLKAQNLKLIYNGDILQNGKNLIDYNYIEETIIELEI